ncbi:MAG: hypothetical protein AB1631_17400 [Acidobacteriota bacterium]
MLALQIQTELTGPIARPAGELSRLLNRNVTTAINSVMAEAKRIAQAPIPRGPSGIRKSIELERARISTGEAKLETTHPLFRFVEERTRPHVIAPKNKKALAFRPRRSRKMVFTKRVVHPGTAGKRSFAAADTFVERSLGPQLEMAVFAALDGRELPRVTSAVLSALQGLL